MYKIYFFYCQKKKILEDAALQQLILCFALVFVSMPSSAAAKGNGLAKSGKLKF